MNLVIVTYAFPPIMAPRSIQIARLLECVRFPMKVYCGDDPASNDATLKVPTAVASLEVTRMRRAGWELFYDGGRYLLYRDLVYLPDRFLRWSKRAARLIERREKLDRTNDVLVTFGNPMSCHLAGLRLKEKSGIPWVAHFSDPWADNPLPQWGKLARTAARDYEGKVASLADRLLFTSQETLELVMAKYSSAIRTKARVLPHCFDVKQNPAPVAEKNRLVCLRYLGDFYGQRTPEPLFRALRQLQEHSPQLLEDTSFELFGSLPNRVLANCPTYHSLPPGLVKVRPTVAHREALDLMNHSDALLVIDAPIEPSPFFPSKLADYIGAARPVLGFTPPGASARIIRELGGWVVDPRDEAAGAKVLGEVLTQLKQHSPGRSWMNEAVRQRYNAKNVARQFESILQELSPCAAS